MRIWATFFGAMLSAVMCNGVLAEAPPEGAELTLTVNSAHVMQSPLAGEAMKTRQLLEKMSIELVSPVYVGPDHFTVQYSADDEQRMRVIQIMQPRLNWTKSTQPHTYNVSLEAGFAATLISQAVEANIDVIKRRMTRLGIDTPAVTHEGGTRIKIVVPPTHSVSTVKHEVLVSTSLRARTLCDTTVMRAYQRHQSRSRLPADCQLSYTSDDQPILLKRDAIIIGDDLLQAKFGRSQHVPAVFITLNATGGKKMRIFSTANIGKQMAITLVSSQPNEMVNGRELTRKPVEEVLQVATIQSAVGAFFMITGVDGSRAKAIADKLNERSLAITLSE